MCVVSSLQNGIVRMRDIELWIEDTLQARLEGCRCVRKVYDAMSNVHVVVVFSDVIFLT